MHHDHNRGFGIDRARLIYLDRQMFSPQLAKKEKRCFNFYVEIISCSFGYIHNSQTHNCLNYNEKEMSLTCPVHIKFLCFSPKVIKSKYSVIYLTKILNMKFYKNLPSAVTFRSHNVTTEQRRNNGLNSHFLQPLCKFNQNGLMHAGRYFIWVRLIYYWTVKSVIF